MPSAVLVLDAAILIAAVRGRSSGALVEAARNAALVTTDRVVQEARRRIELGLRRPELLSVLDELVSELAVVPTAILEPFRESSEQALRLAVASRRDAVSLRRPG